MAPSRGIDPNSRPDATPRRALNETKAGPEPLGVRRPGRFKRGAPRTLLLAGSAMALGSCASVPLVGGEDNTLMSRTELSCINPFGSTFKCFDGTISKVMANPAGARAPDGDDEPDEIETASIDAGSTPGLSLASAQQAPPARKRRKPEPIKPGPYRAKPFRRGGPRTRSFDKESNKVSEQVSSQLFAKSFSGVTMPLTEADKVIHAPELRRYSEGILRDLLQYSPVEPPEIGIHITASTNWGGSATIENDIFIKLGSFKQAQSEGEIAALLAHEAAHILLEHFDRDEYFNRQMDMLENGVGAVLLASKLIAAAETREGTEQEKQEGQAQAEKTTLKAAGVALGMQFVTSDVIGSSWQRRQEEEADLLGADLTLSAGYSQNALLAVMDILKGIEESRELNVERMEQRTKRVRAELEADPNLNKLVETGAFVALNLFDAMFKDVTGWIASAHGGAEVREKNVRGYVRREFGGRSAKGRKGQLQAIKRSNSFKRLYSRYTQVFEALAQHENDDPEAALATLRGAMKGTVAGDPFPRTLEAQILTVLDRPEDALRAYKRVRPGSVLSPESYTHQAELQLALGRHNAALRTAQTADKHYGPDLFHATKIKAYYATNQPEKLQAERTACEASALKPAKKACREALSAIPPEQGGTLGEGALNDFMQGLNSFTEKLSGGDLNNETGAGNTAQ